MILSFECKRCQAGAIPSFEWKHCLADGVTLAVLSYECTIRYYLCNPEELQISAIAACQHSYFDLVIGLRCEGPYEKPQRERGREVLKRTNPSC